MNLADMQEQFDLERLNEQYYLALSAAADEVNRPGASAFFEKSANNEHSHAKRVRDYIVDRNGSPEFNALEEIPPIDGNKYLELFNMALDRERITTESLTTKYKDSDDVQTQAFLISSQGDWVGFIVEQTQSERELTDMIIKISRLSEDGLEVFDNWLLETWGK